MTHFHDQHQHHHRKEQVPEVRAMFDSNAKEDANKSSGVPQYPRERRHAAPKLGIRFSEFK
eukprot:CAMPEP_0171499054 /NCGR_PEP_ID=MMETSP0958-20121227/8219_1 /TAXON_ID=87120 /ORGANISM="Aurantiochytrium limacinum, Strain ATCCMYA-1381" /LENGTH=60 /DNA_ID=CAMNT_0012033575 /DNA_START=332 /DNA_END=514 /DNA_ORIENTATION=-